MTVAFFSAIETAFLEARKCGSLQTSHYQLAGQPVQIEVVGATLSAHILPPFSHLKATIKTPSLQVRLWDAHETGIPCPLGLPTEARSDEWSSPSQSFAYGYERRYVEYRSLAGTTWLDRATNVLYGCYNDARRFSIYDYSRPLPWLLPAWCNDFGVQSVHAGMVSWQGNGILLAGKSGSGKTTATLACLNDGFDYLAEDQVGISESDGEFEGFSFYNTARLDENHLQRFARLAPYACHEADQKTLLMLSDLFPNQFLAQAPIRALLLPKITEAVETTLEPANAADALRAIAANSLMLPMGGGKRGFERLARLVRAVPCYWLIMGSDLDSIPAAVRGAVNS